MCECVSECVCVSVNELVCVHARAFVGHALWRLPEEALVFYRLFLSVPPHTQGT